jgi:hypothetical protein
MSSYKKFSFSPSHPIGASTPLKHPDFLGEEKEEITADLREWWVWEVSQKI